MIKPYIFSFEKKNEAVLFITNKYKKRKEKFSRIAGIRYNNGLEIPEIFFPSLEQIF
jgi:hypothetical protein